jgi:hypothetical protein
MRLSIQVINHQAKCPVCGVTNRLGADPINCEHLIKVIHRIDQGVHSDRAIFGPFVPNFQVRQGEGV